MTYIIDTVGVYHGISYIYFHTNNVKHGEMEDVFTNVLSDTPAQDVAFTNMMKMDGKMSTQFRHQEY